MPFVFATGYGERGLPEPYRDRPTLKKPFQMDGLKQMLESALDSREQNLSSERPDMAVACRLRPRQLNRTIRPAWS